MVGWHDPSSDPMADVRRAADYYYNGGAMPVKKKHTIKPVKDPQYKPGADSEQTLMMVVTIKGYGLPGHKLKTARGIRRHLEVVLGLSSKPDSNTLHVYMVEPEEYQSFDIEKIDTGEKPVNLLIVKSSVANTALNLVEVEEMDQSALTRWDVAPGET